MHKTIFRYNGTGFLILFISVMTVTTQKQKILLGLLSLFSFLILLEAGLRVGGFIFTLQKEQRNKISLKDNEFRILCLGESTTAIGGENSYPSQLQAILNSRHPEIKFKVINKGRVSKQSQHILAELRENLEKYKPHLVITMIGVNEIIHYADLVGKKNFLDNVNNFFENFRTYNFFKLLGQHIYHKIKDAKTADHRQNSDNTFSLDSPALALESGARSDELDTTSESYVLIKKLGNVQQAYRKVSKAITLESDAAKKKVQEGEWLQLKHKEAWLLYRLGRYHRLRKNYELAESFFKMAVESNPAHFASYYEWGLSCKDQKKYNEAVVMFKKAIRVNPQTILAYFELARSYDQLKAYSQAKPLFEYVLSRKPEDVWIYSEMGKWFCEHDQLTSAEQSYLKAIEKERFPDRFLYTGLADVYEKQGKEKEAEAFRQKAALSDEKTQKYPLVTIRNYNKIVDAIRGMGSKVICMQYPRRDVESLKNIISPHGDVIFVENKTNFEEALHDSGYAALFSDNFADDFGHCTRAGNQLIAENLADVIFNNLVDSHVFKK